MTIVSGSSSPTSHEGGDETAADAGRCASCRKLHDELKSTVTRMGDRLEKLVLRVEEVAHQQQQLRSQVAASLGGGGASKKATASGSRPAPIAATATAAVRPTNGVATAGASQARLVEMLSGLLGEPTAAKLANGAQTTLEATASMQPTSLDGLTDELFNGGGGGRRCGEGASRFWFEDDQF